MSAVAIPSYSFETIGAGVEVCVSTAHTFGTDAFLLSHFAAPRGEALACDLGSGCGIIPLLWMRGDTAPKCVYALDIQPDAIKQMLQSIERSGLSGRMFPLHADLRALPPDLPKGSFDLVVCNPPYKAEGTGLEIGRAHV